MKKVFTKEWFRAAGIRAIKTAAQTALGMFTVGMSISEVPWVYVASLSATAAAFSILTSLGGLPEVE